MELKLLTIIMIVCQTYIYDQENLGYNKDDDDWGQRMTTSMMTMMKMMTMMVEMKEEKEEIVMMMTAQEEEEIMINLEKEKQTKAGAGILHQEGADPEVESPEAL